MVQTVGKIPEFTEDSSAEPEKEVKKAGAEPVEEKETPEPPEEKPVAKSDEDTNAPLPDVQELEKTIAGLQEERVKILKEIKELRGTKREIKQDQLKSVQQQLDDLKDLHPDDVQTIDRVLRSKGYVTKEEAASMFYEAVKQEELDKFLNKYPEYKPENDPDNINWGAFERQIEKEKELGYQLPKNPHLLGTFLERIHREIAPKGNRDSGAALRRRVEVAGVGSGGSQQSSSAKRLDPQRRAIFERGGWSEDEIKAIEAKLE